MSEATSDNMENFNRKDFFVLKTQDGSEFVLIKKETYEHLIRTDASQVLPPTPTSISLKDYVAAHMSLEDLPF